MNNDMTTRTPFSLCVFCASRSGAHPAFEQVATEVGEWLGQRGAQLVYGGGNTGLMGTVAQATLAAGGRVVGIMPKALVEREYANTNCTELHMVDTMHQRKAMMAERADAFLVLPGGIGTFEEFFEVWTWRQLGYHNKPIGLLNQAGHYDGLLGFLRHSVDSALMSPWQMDLIAVDSNAPQLLEQLARDAATTPASEKTNSNTLAQLI